MNSLQKRTDILPAGGIVIAVVLGLYLSSLYSYLLFHVLVELVTIAIAFACFILAWNTRAYLKNNYLRLLGIGYAFIALIDLVHTLAYKGMNVFPGYGANFPTQLWIGARYLQAVTLLAAPLIIERKPDDRVLAGAYTAAVAAVVALITTGNFPDCFIEGKGLTAFKIGSEYAISALLLAALYFFYRKREHFSKRIVPLVAFSIICTILSELSFTAYVSVYGFANMVGHFAKLAAFYLIYRALLVTGLREPFDLIFRELKQAEAALRASQDELEERVRERTAELQASEQRYRSLIMKVPAAIVLHDGQGRIISSNPSAENVLGLSGDQLLGKVLIDPEWHFVREDGSVMPVAEYPVSLVLSGRRPLAGYVMGISRPDREGLTWAMVNAEPEYDEAGGVARVIVSFVDITGRKRAEEDRRESEARYRRIVDTAVEGICSLGPDAMITFVNARMAELLGRSGGELLGRPLSDFMFEEDAADHVNKLEDRRQGRSESYERRFRRANGETVWTLVSAAPIFDEQRHFLGSFAMYTDITERKLADAELRRLKDELEQRVRVRTMELEAKNGELEKLNKLFVGRELRMVELKHRIGELEKVK